MIFSLCCFYKLQVTKNDVITYFEIKSFLIDFLGSIPEYYGIFQQRKKYKNDTG